MTPAADPFLALVRELDRERHASAELQAPVFAVPAKVARQLGWGTCTGCQNGVTPGTTTWFRGQPFHASCAAIEATHVLRSAA